ncbi:MAG TPA: type II toxin-antitoxin system PemK/MazF family toxin [Stellaceae bacterium]|nr:type II toxin-antitoxin system PemK/MazF family toxin [Stellaceae bacterium]
MPNFSRFDIVAVPFPYTDRPRLQRRPALVISHPAFEERFGLLWVLMITAAENAGWADDVPIPDHAAAGLPIPSIIRPSKIATIEAARAQNRGKIDDATARAVEAAVTAYIA